MLGVRVFDGNAEWMLFSPCLTNAASLHLRPDNECAMICVRLPQ